MGAHDRRVILPMAIAVGAAMASACRSPAYAPCPVELSAPLPSDAFQRCRDVLRQRYGRLEVADPAAFRLQTGWSPVAQPAGERRATLFRESVPGEPGLVVIVEVRRPAVPLVGPPAWTEPRGDAVAERELAALLREALAADAASR